MPITEVTNVDVDKELEDGLDESIEGEGLEGELVDDGEIDEGAEQDELADEGEQSEVAEPVVSIDGEEPAENQDASAPQWVKELRRNQRELQKENRELKKRIEGNERTSPQIEAVGKRPTLEEFEYDTPKYEEAIDAWHARKYAAERAESAAAETQRVAQQAWKTKLDGYADSKKKLAADNFDDAEETVFARLNVTQQGIIIQIADNPAAMIYALNAYPARLAELAGQQEPLQFAASIAKLETKLKMGTRTATPSPEKRLGSSGSGSGKGGTLDNTLNRLRAEAETSNDYTKLMKYKADLKKKQK